MKKSEAAQVSMCWSLVGYKGTLRFPTVNCKLASCTDRTQISLGFFSMFRAYSKDVFKDSTLTSTECVGFVLPPRDIPTFQEVHKSGDRSDSLCQVDVGLPSSTKIKDGKEN